MNRRVGLRNASPSLRREFDRCGSLHKLLLEAGFDHFLVKPTPPKVLTDIAAQPRPST